MGIRKAQEGCTSCSQSYFALAKRHGASDQEIQQAINNTANGMKSHVSRRDFLKLATVTALGVAIAEMGVKPQSVEAGAYYYGTDSYTQTVSGIPQNFYIGRLGYGITTNNPYAFNTSAATNAGYSKTYEYWGIEGPSSPNRQTGETAYNWGNRQGTKAAQQWFNHSPNAIYVGGQTIFADIESGFQGYSGTQTEWRSIVNGFLDGVYNYYPQSPFTPGIYTNFSTWNTYIGSSFRPSRNFVFWITSCRSGTTCNPCSCGGSVISQVDSLVPTVTGNIMGGCLPVIWQYWLNPPFGCGDFIVAIQNPGSGFSPRTSATTYQNNC
jgi:hypothetical protein